MFLQNDKGEYVVNKLGLYVQQNFDVGDSSHRTGTAMAIHVLLGDKLMAEDIADTVTEHLEVQPGIYIRHPGGYLPMWSPMPNAFSRDQASRLMLGFAILGRKDKLRDWFKAMKSRYFFHQNTLDPVTGERKFPDIMGPGEVRNLIRGLDLWYLYPILFMLDFLFLFDIVLRKRWDGASLILVDLVYACRKYTTPGALLARFVAKRTTMLEEALNNHAPENNGCVELQELFRRLMK